jgi:hypothetical protein
MKSLFSTFIVRCNATAIVYYNKAKGSFGQKEFDIQLSDIPRVISLAYNGRSFYNM